MISDVRHLTYLTAWHFTVKQNLKEFFIQVVAARVPPVSLTRPLKTPGWALAEMKNNQARAAFRSIDPSAVPE
jgi:hypothetical protein